MNWPDIMKTLQERGWKQQQLAERAKCSQSTISELRSGSLSDPRHSLGEALRELYESAERPAKEAA